MLLAGIIALSIVLQPVYSAGIAVHNTIAARTRHFFPSEIQSDHYVPFILAGSFFPDAFYKCSIWANASEDAHWPPFLHTAVKYYNQISTTGGEDDEDLLQFKAFLYGIYTHEVVDSSWHSLGMKEGLMEMFSAMEFPGRDSFDRGHAFLDTAGDFLHLYKVADVSFYLTQWRLPNVKYLIDVFQQRGFEITEGEFRSCVAVGQSGIASEVTVREPSGRYVLQESPILSKYLEDYFIGGLRDVAKAVERCLPNLNTWFEGHEEAHDWNLCGSIIRSHSTSERAIRNITVRSTDTGLVISPYSPLTQFGHALAVGNFFNEPSLAVSDIEADGSVYLFPLSEFVNTDVNKITSQSYQKCDVPILNKDFMYTPRLGSTLAKFRLFSHDLLLVTEPGSSQIFIYFQKEIILTIYNCRTSTRYGSGGHKEQFTTIETVRSLLNEDVDDLIVASPMDDIKGSPESGIVRIISGRSIQQLILSGVKRVDIHKVTSHTLTPQGQFKLTEGYEQFGTAVGVSSKYIFVSSRGLGLVFVYDLVSLQLVYVLNQTNVNRWPTGSVSRKVSKESRLFGEWIKTGTFNGAEYVLVSAAAYGNGMPGAVFAYVIDPLDQSLDFKNIITIKNTFDLFSNSQFGTAGEIDSLNEAVYISAPMYKGHGAVFKVKLADVLGTKDPSQVEIVLDDETVIVLEKFGDICAETVYADDMIIEGNGFKSRNGKGYTGLGASLAFIDGFLIVSEEFFGFDEPFDHEKYLTGRVTIYDMTN